MRIRIPIISALLYYFKIFYSYVQYKLFILILLIFLAGIFEGLGISLVIPLLIFDGVGTAGNRYCQFVYGFLNSVGIGVSLGNLLVLLVT